MENSKLKHDVFESTYGWRILVQDQYDYRKEKVGNFIIKGYSKYEGIPEPKNKKNLLLLNLSMLFEKRWIHKCKGILIYRNWNGMMLYPLEKNRPIIYFKNTDQRVEYGLYDIFADEFVEKRIAMMCDDYNRGLQHNIGLHVA